jgi:nicotinate-nucleotide adenylyltransferase
VTVTVAVFGGSFNPPHVAHVLGAVLVLSCHPVDRVLVVPAFHHPFQKALAPFEERLRMCELAMGWLPRVEVSRIEERLGGEGKTLHTLQHLAREHADWRLRLVMGADLLAESSKWYRFDEVERLAPPILIGRAGTTKPREGGVPDARLPEVSSTDVRARIAAGAWDGLEECVPSAVLEHIRARRLYRDAEDGSASPGQG